MEHKAIKKTQENTDRHSPAVKRLGRNRLSRIKDKRKRQTERQKDREREILNFLTDKILKSEKSIIIISVKQHLTKKFERKGKIILKASCFEAEKM